MCKGDPLSQQQNAARNSQRTQLTREEEAVGRSTHATEAAKSQVDNEKVQFSRPLSHNATVKRLNTAEASVQAEQKLQQQFALSETWAGSNVTAPGARQQELVTENAQTAAICTSQQKLSEVKGHLFCRPEQGHIKAKVSREFTLRNAQQRKSQSRRRSQVVHTTGVRINTKFCKRTKSTYSERRLQSVEQKRKRGQS